MPDRPRVYRTEGIILRRRNLGEADSIFTVYSDREGKFEAIARGVRKARSRMRGHLEPLTRTRMLIARGRNLDVFTQAETVDPYRRLREELEGGAVALYCAELVDGFVGEHQELPGLYGLLVETLEALDGGAGPALVRHFEVNLLALAGYELQLEACAVCGAALPPEPALLSASAGGLVCGPCRPKAGSGHVLGVRAIKVLRFARTAGAEAFASVRIDTDLAHELQLAMSEVVRHILEREPRTRRYLDDVVALGRRAKPALNQSP